MYKKENQILIDVGSSTIKIYSFFNNNFNHLFSRSIPFKKDFNPRDGISENNKREFFELIDVLKQKNKDSKIKIYATAVFRKLSREAKIAFIDEVFQRTGVFFNIIDQELENFYSEIALVGRCFLNEPILLINIGGSSIELTIMYGREAIENKNVDFGVSDINTKFPQINEQTSNVEFKKIIEFIKERLPNFSNKTKIAFYSGGELTYMQLVGYPLMKNNLFEDNRHPSLIFVEDFSKKNQEIFKITKLSYLESLMPNNPMWMHGARSCSAIAQAVCEKYELKTIIPSDSNIIDGAIQQEFRYITISGSFRKHMDYILQLKKELETASIEILSLRFAEPKNPGEDFVIFAGEEGRTPLELERHHLNSIENSDALIVCDPGGYVEASALIEIGYAHAIGKKIIFTEPPEEFILNALPAEVGL